MILSFHACLSADRQIVLGARVPGEREKELIRAAQAVVLPQARWETLYRACRAAGVPCFPDYEARLRYPGKTGQARLFDSLNLPHPPTRCWPSPAALTKACRKGFPAHELPFYIKTDAGHEGEGVFLVNSPRELEGVLKLLAERQCSSRGGLITQAAVPGGGRVLRAVLIGRKTYSYWKVSAGKNSSIITISRGARVDRHWRPDLQQQGRSWARRLAAKSGINLAAADLLFPDQQGAGEPLFLEINYFFGRRGLGGSLNYYRLLKRAVQGWLAELGLDPGRVKLL